MLEILLYCALTLFIVWCLWYLSKDKILKVVMRKSDSMLNSELEDCKILRDLYLSASLGTLYLPEEIPSMVGKHFIVSESGLVTLTEDGKRELEILEAEMDYFLAFQKLRKLTELKTMK